MQVGGRFFWRLSLMLALGLTATLLGLCVVAHMTGRG
jgi:hypothetical protein